MNMNFFTAQKSSNHGTQLLLFNLGVVCLYYYIVMCHTDSVSRTIRTVVVVITCHLSSVSDTLGTVFVVTLFVADMLGIN